MPGLKVNVGGGVSFSPGDITQEPQRALFCGKEGGQSSKDVCDGFQAVADISCQHQGEALQVCHASGQAACQLQDGQNQQRHTRTLLLEMSWS